MLCLAKHFGSGIMMLWSVYELRSIRAVSAVHSFGYCFMSVLCFLCLILHGFVICCSCVHSSTADPFCEQGLFSCEPVLCMIIQGDHTAAAIRRARGMKVHRGNMAKISIVLVEFVVKVMTIMMIWCSVYYYCAESTTEPYLTNKSSFWCICQNYSGCRCFLLCQDSILYVKLDDLQNLEVTLTMVLAFMKQLTECCKLYAVVAVVMLLPPDCGGKGVMLSGCSSTTFIRSFIHLDGSCYHNNS